MGTKIFAAVTMIFMLVFVILNDIALGSSIDELTKMVEKSETYTEAEAVQGFYNEKKEFIGLSVNHSDLTEIGQLLCEYVAELHEEADEASVTKSRLITALMHLRRLSSANWESII